MPLLRRSKFSCKIFLTRRPIRLKHGNICTVIKTSLKAQNILHSAMEDALPIHICNRLKQFAKLMDRGWHSGMAAIVKREYEIQKNFCLTHQRPKKRLGRMDFASWVNVRKKKITGLRSEQTADPSSQGSYIVDLMHIPISTNPLSQILR